MNSAGTLRGKLLGMRPELTGPGMVFRQASKEVAPGSLDNERALKGAADKARRSIFKAGYRDQGAILFIRALGVSKIESEGIDHLAKMAGGPAFSRISIRTRDGWAHYGD